MPIPPQHRPGRVVRVAPHRTTAADRHRRRSAQGPGGLIIGLVLTVGAFGVLIAAFAAKRGADSAPATAVATPESLRYARVFEEIVRRIKASPSVDVLLANRTTFNQEINDSTALTEPQKESMRWEVIREVEARKEAITATSAQR